MRTENWGLLFVLFEMLHPLRGSCHCGFVSFEVDLPDERQMEVLECNCTICTKKGCLHLIISRERLRLLSPASEEELGLYQFGSKTARHYFCPRCGICSFYVPKSHPDGYSVNLRALDCYDEIKNTVTIKPFDGRNNWDASAAKTANMLHESK